MKTYISIFLFFGLMNYTYSEQKGITVRSNIAYFRSENGFFPGIVDNYWSSSNEPLSTKLSVYKDIYIPEKYLPQLGRNITDKSPIIFESLTKEEYEKDHPLKIDLNLIKNEEDRKKAFIEMMKDQAVKRKRFPGYSIIPFPSETAEIIRKKPELNIIKIDDIFCIVGLFLKADFNRVFFAFNNIKPEYKNMKDKYITLKAKNISVKLIPLPKVYLNRFGNMINTSHFLPATKLIELKEYSKILKEEEKKSFIKKTIKSLSSKYHGQLIYGNIDLGNKEIQQNSVYFKYKASPIKNVRFSNEYKKFPISNKNFAFFIQNSYNVAFFFDSDQDSLDYSTVKYKFNNVKIIQCEVTEEDIEADSDLIERYVSLHLDSGERQYIIKFAINKRKGLEIATVNQAELPKDCMYLNVKQDHEKNLIVEEIDDKTLPEEISLHFSGNNCGLKKTDFKTFLSSGRIKDEGFKQQIQIDSDSLNNTKKNIFFFFKYNGFFGRGVISYRDEYSNVFEYNGNNDWKLTLGVFLEYPFNKTNIIGKRIKDERDGF